jgi:hypothetical protein
MWCRSILVLMVPRDRHHPRLYPFISVSTQDLPSHRNDAFYAAEKNIANRKYALKKEEEKKRKGKENPKSGP